MHFHCETSPKKIMETCFSFSWKSQGLCAFEEQSWRKAEKHKHRCSGGKRELMLKHKNSDVQEGVLNLRVTCQCLHPWRETSFFY